MTLSPRLSFVMPSFAVGIVMVMSGCVTIPRVTPELVAVAVQRDATTTVEILETGRALYVNRCASCHSLSAPMEFEEREWRSWVHKMAPKARLTAGQEVTLVTFLLTARDAAIKTEAAEHPPH